MLTTHAVGIDLGTTYSCIAYLNEQGEPVSIPNQEGEISTPSVVMYDRGEEIVGTEALRNTIINPAHVVQNAKRFMGDMLHRWTIDGKSYTPIDISAAILRKLLSDAQRQIGPTERAVITVPAQFSELQRLATVEAGMQAGLKQVDIINEPVAAALCYVLGAEGLWFTELASEQRILVYDLGGGTFDLSVVIYKQNEVRVIASGGDLNLGGIDWNDVLVNAVADQFTKEFGEDPRHDLESLQHLAWEVEQCKRSLTIRPKAALICQHAGKRKTYQIEQEQFNQLTRPLVDKTELITRQLLKDNKMGWAHIDVVLSMGGSSRMPMIREILKKMSGRTLNTSLSPDQSIAHGATYYAGMLLSNSEFVHSILNAEASARLSRVKQQSVSARGLGILIRNVKSNTRVPYYLIPANTPLPTSATHTFGTVIPNQKRVHLHIVESGAGSNDACVELGTCAVEGLPPNLPVDSEIAVTISYDSSARVHVSARDVASGKEATTEIIRQENLTVRDIDEPEEDMEVTLMPVPEERGAPPLQAAAPPARASSAASRPDSAASPKPTRKPGSAMDESVVPIPLCDRCGEPLNARGQCPSCPPKGVARPAAPTKPPAAKPAPAAKNAVKPVQPVPAPSPAKARSPVPSVKPVPSSLGADRVQPAIQPVPVPKRAADAASPSPRPASRPSEGGRPLEGGKSVPSDDDEIMELPVKKKPGTPPKNAKPRSKSDPVEAGEDEFWSMTEQ